MQPADDDPHPPSIDTGEFFLPGADLSILLIHGLSGTPYEMRSLGDALAAAGHRVLGVRLAGHGGSPEELGATSHDNWYESVVEGFESLRQYGDPNLVVGLSMGAILAARLAIDQREAVSAIAMLAPAFFLPARTRFALRLMRRARSFGDVIYFRKSGGSDIHDAAARSVHPGNRLMPLGAALSLIDLSDLIRPRLEEVVQPTLLIHSRLDHTCPYQRNVEFVMGHLGSTDKRALALEESFHVITVDSERDKVARETLDFAAQFSRATAVSALG